MYPLNKQELKERQKNINFFGRRVGKTLSPLQKQILQETLDNYLIKLEDLKNESTIYNLFPNKDISEIRIEIGYGGGEYLRHHAQTRPNAGFIGVEPFEPGIIKMGSYLKLNPSAGKNIRIYNDDASAILRTLPDNCLSGIDIFYPDPWQKTKHKKRRFINKENLEQICRISKDKATLRFASDIPDYINWTLWHCGQHNSITWEAESCNDWRTPYPDWVSTRYEQKAIREKRTPNYLLFSINK